MPRPLPRELTQLEFILVDRGTMRKAHADFLGDGSETDVITFPYGEILICPAVAQDQAIAHGLKVEEEILLYGLHALLHLAGYRDNNPKAARVMAIAQNRLLGKLLSVGKPMS